MSNCRPIGPNYVIIHTWLCNDRRHTWACILWIICALIKEIYVCYRFQIWRYHWPRPTHSLCFWLYVSQDIQISFCFIGKLGEKKVKSNKIVYISCLFLYWFNSFERECLLAIFITLTCSTFQLIFVWLFLYLQLICFKAVHHMQAHGFLYQDQDQQDVR